MILKQFAVTCLCLLNANSSKQNDTAKNLYVYKYTINKFVGELNNTINITCGSLWWDGRRIDVFHLIILLRLNGYEGNLAPR